MKIDFDLYVIITLVGTVQGFISTIMLLLVKRNRVANRFLGLLVLGFSLQSFDYFLFKSGVYLQHNEFYFLPVYYSLAFGPLLYFYLRTLINTAGNTKSLRYHFIPVFIQFIFYTSISISTLSYKTFFWINIHQPYTQRIELYASILSLSIYLFFSIRLLQSYRKKIENHFSNTKGINLTWLRNLLLGLCILYLGWLGEHLSGNFRYGIVQLFLPIYIYWIAWMGFLQRSLVSNPVDSQQGSSQMEKKQPETSPAMLLAIKQAMEDDKLYLNPGLTITDLARHVDLPPKLVSFMINADFGKSFNSYINEYRVNEFKNKLISEQNKRFTLLGLAFDSGFNSQASFYRIFREVTGLSPKEYHKTVVNTS